jgi:hypothetical protein
MINIKIDQLEQYTYTNKSCKNGALSHSPNTFLSISDPFSSCDDVMIQCLCEEMK